MDLTHKKCVPCEGGTKPFTKQEISNYMDALKTSWEIIDDKKLRQKFEFKNFSEALEFINKVGHRAEKEGHHPDIFLTDYKFVTIELMTNAIRGLSVNDFILAAKIEEL